MRRALLAASAAAALLAPGAPAAAQGTDIGGRVDSLLELSLDEGAGFDALGPGPGAHTMDVVARVTTTEEERTQLSIADGDVVRGPLLGRLPGAGAGALRLPLEARVGRTAAFLPLDAQVDPLLASWSGPVANASARIELRQRVEAGETPGTDFEKTVMITVSPDVP